MKKSFYNFIFENDEKKAIAFNSNTCALAEIEEDFLHMLNNIESINYENLDINQKKLFDDMKEGGYIIDDCIDEKKEIKFRNLTSRFYNGSLSLTIAPTLNCNFKCIYCYETAKNVVMTGETEKYILEFVKKQINSIKQLNITWYGGEPLLCKNIIYNLSESLISMCDENNVKYGAYIITNGYLLDDDTVKNFKKYKISGAQITVDGPAHIHNKRRVLKSREENNFETVINSIKKLKKSNLRPGVRINIDKSNIKYVDELLNFFKQNEMSDVGIHFGQVTEYTQACKSIGDYCYDTEDFSKILIDLQNKLNENGFKGAIGSIYYPSLKGNYCGADQINSFVIDPEGYMYKCWNEIGYTNYSIGNIKDISKNLKPESYQFSNTLKYATHSPFDSKECVECKLLPVCMGGCPYFNVNRDTSKPCEKWKYNLEQIIKYTYTCNKCYPKEFKEAFGELCGCL